MKWFKAEIEPQSLEDRPAAALGALGVLAALVGRM